MAKKPAAPKPEASADDVGAAPSPRSTPALIITSAREGFRRAGRPWSATPTRVDIAEFTAEQLAMLRAEPMLTIEDVA